MKNILILLVVFFTNATNLYSQRYEGKFENTTPYEVYQYTTDTSYSYKLKNKKTGKEFALLDGKILNTEAFTEEQHLPQIIKIVEIDFDQKDLKEIILEYSINYTTQKGESGADSKTKSFLKIINLDKTKTLLDIFFFEETNNFFYNHNLNEDFIERSDKSYIYNTSSGNNYFISKEKIYFINISDDSSKDMKSLKYNKTKDLFEEE